MSGVEAEAYWLVRVGGEFVVTPGAAPGELFPQGCGNALAGLDQALHIGEWQGAPCYAIDVEALAGKLNKLRDMLMESDAQAIELLDSVREPLRSRFGADRMRELEHRIDNFDFEAALQLLQDLTDSAGVAPANHP